MKKKRFYDKSYCKKPKRSYYQLAKAKVEREIAKSKVEYSEVEAEYNNRHVFVSTLLSSPKNPAIGAEDKRIKI